MIQFRRIDTLTVRAELTVFERMLLASLVEQLIEVLGDEKDPAIERLLPNAYIDDPEAAAEFRRFTMSGLAERKVLNARVVLDAVSDQADEASATSEASGTSHAGPIELDARQAQQWLSTLTDLRLTLANRLGIKTDDDEGRTDAAAEPLQQSYHWLGVLQESLVLALDR